MSRIGQDSNARPSGRASSNSVPLRHAAPRPRLPATGCDPAAVVLVGVDFLAGCFTDPFAGVFEAAAGGFFGGIFEAIKVKPTKKLQLGDDSRTNERQTVALRMN